MLHLLRPDSSNLLCLYSTFHLEYPLVLSRFCFGKYLINEIISELAGVIVGSVTVVIIVIVVFGVLVMRGGMSVAKSNKVCVSQFSFLKILKISGRMYMSVG